MRLHGDYNSETASLIELKVEKCKGHDYCKEVEELESFFRKKYLILLTNQVRFTSFKLGEEALIEESVLQWMPLESEGQFRQ